VGKSPLFQDKMVHLAALSLQAHRQLLPKKPRKSGANLLGRPAPFETESSWPIFVNRKVVAMDTMTYAAVAALPWAIAENNKQPVVLEPEIVFVDLSSIFER
jgi:hypothetical protein